MTANGRYAYVRTDNLFKASWIRRSCRSWCVWIGCFILCFFATTGCVFAATANAIPPQSRLVVDQARALNNTEKKALEERLRIFQESGRAQVAILISSGTHGEPLADYALRVAETWQLGHAGRDDGLLIMVVPSINAARIEVGYGLEGDIPDVRASRWLDELLPALKKNDLAGGLNRLLDNIDETLALTAKSPNAGNDDYLFPNHPEWRLPFVLAVFSPLTLFPLFFSRWGSLASAPLLAGFLGGAAWALWNSKAAAIAIAGAAFPLPICWGMNWVDSDGLTRWLRYVKAFGNLVAVLMFFSVITLFVGVGLSAGDVQQVWAAPYLRGCSPWAWLFSSSPGSPHDIL